MEGKLRLRDTPDVIKELTGRHISRQAVVNWIHRGAVCTNYPENPEGARFYRRPDGRIALRCYRDPMLYIMRGDLVDFLKAKGWLS